jgi:hypothetical protein
MKKPKIVIRINGGIVQAVYSDTDLEINVIDNDVCDLEEEEITKYTDPDGNISEGYVYEGDVLIHDPVYTEKLSKEIKENKPDAQ